jgi:oligopeptide/dipeptide ABC transporter ATP-binding protein
LTALAIMGLVSSGRVEGELRLEGEDLLQASPDRMRDLRGSRLSMIFQNPRSALNPVLTVGQQIGETLNRHKGTLRRDIRPAVVQLLGEVGIAEPERRFDAYPHELSGGMCQRVMIAMALACDPMLLIADEPTTALDVTVQKQIMDLLGGLCLRRGAAILLITHDLGVVAEHADRAAVAYAGRIVETAPTALLLGRPAHPYTRDLLRAMPDLEGDARRFNTIPGSVPDLVNLPSGCPFAPRCDRAEDLCRREAPDARRLLGGGSVRCWRPLAEVVA